MSKKDQIELLQKSSDFKTAPVDMELFKYFSAQVELFNNTDFSAVCYLEVSNSNTWVKIEDTETEISDADSIVIFDFVTGTSKVRMGFDVTSGTSDVLINYMLKG
jgi:molybdopterin converting factor small subunit